MNFKKKIILCIAIPLLMGCSNFTQKNNTIFYDDIQFTVLSSGLIAIKTDVDQSDYFNNNSFKDFKVYQKGNQLMIKTNHNKLVYTKGKTSLLKRIEIEFQKGSTSITTTISNKDTQNLGGVIQRADRMDGRLEHQNYDTASPTTPKQFPNGLLSEQGFTVLKNDDGRLIHNDTKGESNEYFVFTYGNNYKSALKDFTNLNGAIPMLPKWSLGNWFSRYQPLKDIDYKAIVTRFRKEKIPIDVIVPDMNWHKDGWYGTRFDEQNFPDMKEFLSWTNDNGIHIGFNHHPGALIPNDPRSQIFARKTGLNIEELVEKTDSIYKATNWENIKGTAFYEEEDWKHVKPYFDTFLAPIMDLGLDFHWVDGTPSLENLREYYTATQNYKNNRAIVLTRQGYGSFDHHKYPIGFSADTYISWESLKFNIETTLNGANNGVYWSHDIGGHMAKNGDEGVKSELFARWIQFGAMTPFNRLHATGGVTLDKRKSHIRKPWEWGTAVLNSARNSMQLKYKLMPYVYTLNRQAFDAGLIMTRGMYFDFPQYAAAYKYRSSQYLMGPSILVAPITKASEETNGLKVKSFKNLWIPEGTWYDYFSGEAITGPKETMVSKSIDEMPIFMKEGAIIPMQEYVDFTDQKPLDNLIIAFYQASSPLNSSFNLYEDDGKTMDYAKNECRWTQIDYSYAENEKTEITIHPTAGSFKNEVNNRSYTLVVKHLKKLPKIIHVNGQILNESKWSISDKSTLTIKTDSYHVKTKLAINFI
ncbi:MAG: glycoside hydrolase family 31 protein [Polaribacter sp.]|nr:glycoside hydrolase family 31 protein [Polaribacter sp.]